MNKLTKALHENKTAILMLGYTSQEAANNGQAPIIREPVLDVDQNPVTADTVFPTAEQLYMLATQSREVPVLDQNRQPVLDDQGNPMMHETNWFADAVDVLEEGQ